MHKKEKSCDGVRNKSKFVPINKFSELDLLSGKVPLLCDIIYILLLRLNSDRGLGTRFSLVGPTKL